MLWYTINVPSMSFIFCKGEIKNKNILQKLLTHDCKGVIIKE